MSRWRCVAIDLDGTLLPDTTACRHLADWLGHRDVIDELEERFAAGTISNTVVADGDAAHYRGQLAEDVCAAMVRARFVRDAGEVVADLRSRGLHVLLCTVSWTFAAKAVAEAFGFDGYCGTGMEVDVEGRLSGSVASYFEPEDKVAYVRDYCARIGIPMSAVVAIGDGRSDIPLFRAAGFSVALNGTEEARRAASVSVTSAFLCDAVRAVPGLVEQHSREQLPK